MPKVKTHKSVAKRITLTKTGKLKKVKAGQGHFNSRESGKVTRHKRQGDTLSKVHTKNVKKLIPYS
jgi:large subunit ribosomal protein L35